MKLVSVCMYSVKLFHCLAVTTVLSNFPGEMCERLARGFVCRV